MSATVKKYSHAAFYFISFNSFIVCLLNFMRWYCFLQFYDSLLEPSFLFFSFSKFSLLANPGAQT